MPATQSTEEIRTVLGTYIGTHIETKGRRALHAWLILETETPFMLIKVRMVYYRATIQTTSFIREYESRNAFLTHIGITDILYENGDTVESKTKQNILNEIKETTGIQFYTKEIFPTVATKKHRWVTRPKSAH